MTKKEREKLFESLKPFSYSRISLYQQCPYAFKEHYVNGKGGRVSEQADFGKIVHSITQRLWIGEEPDITADIDDKTIENIRDNISLLKERIKEDIGEIKENHIEKQFWVCDEPDKPQYYGFEKKDNPLFTGIVDILSISDSPVVIEIKSAYQFSKRHEKQLKIYMFCLYQIYDCKEIYGYLFYPLSGMIKMYKIGEYDDVKIGEKLFRSILLMKDEIIRLGVLDEPKPNPSSYCQYCPVLHECPYKPKDTILFDIDAVEVGKKILILEAQLKDLKDKLKKWVDRTGMVINSQGVFIGYRILEKKEINTADFVKTMKKMGDNPIPYLKVDLRRAAKLLSNPEIKKIVKVSRYTRFSIKNTEEAKDEK